MHINDVDVLDLLERYPELQKIRDITARHGEMSDISEICEVIAHLYQRLDSKTQSTTANVKSSKTEK